MGGINSEYTGQPTYSPQAAHEEEPHLDYNPRLGQWYSQNPKITPQAAGERARERGLQYHWTGQHAGEVTINPQLAERAMRARMK